MDASGVLLPWRSNLRPNARPMTDLAEMQPGYRAAFEAEISKLIHRDVLIPVEDPSSVLASCIAFLVFRDGKARLCADQSHYKPFLTEATCQYEDPLRILADPATTSSVLGDANGAFQCMTWSQRDRPYVGIILVDGSRVLGLLFKRASFGMSHSPPQWEAAISKATAIARGSSPLPPTVAVPTYLAAAISASPPPSGLRFVDDSTITDRGRPEWAVRGLRRLVATYALFGVLPSVSKLFPWPCSFIVSVGVGWDHPTRTARVTEEKAAKLARLASSASEAVALLPQLIPSPPPPPIRRLIRPALASVRFVTGLLSFFTVAVPQIALFRSPLDDLTTELVFLLGGVHQAPPSGASRNGRQQRLLAARRASDGPSPPANASLRDSAIRILAFWRSRAPQLHTWRHRRFQRAVERVVRGVSDSSDTTGGIVLWVPGRPPIILVMRFSADQAAASSGFRELLPVRMALDYCQRHGIPLQGVTFALWTDSTCLVSFLTRWASSSDAVIAEMVILWDLVRRLDLFFITTWCSREHGWLPLSDLITRVNLGALPEYSLEPDTFLLVTETLGVFPEADLFATASSAQTAAFCSRSLAGVSPQALSQLSRDIVAAGQGMPGTASQGGVFERPLPATPESGWLGDAFSFPWRGRRLYAFPPWSQVPAIFTAWDLIPSTSPPSTFLIIVITEQLFDRFARAHGDLVRSCPVPPFPHLRDSHGRPAPGPPPWPLRAALLAR